MKIAINGDIIDTKDIYKITKIQSGYWNTYDIKGWFEPDTNGDTFGFYIIFFNKTQEDYHGNYNKLSKFREQIIKIWSKNQNEIPQFNLE